VHAPTPTTNALHIHPHILTPSHSSIYLCSVQVERARMAKGRIAIVELLHRATPRHPHRTSPIMPLLNARTYQDATNLDSTGAKFLALLRDWA
jgi:hypothetical protein